MKQIQTLIFAAVVGVAALASSAVSAHSDEYLDTQKSPNGGQTRMAGLYHFELVVAKNGKSTKESPVVVYVTDHAGARIPTAGASGTAIILADKTKVTATLVPDGDNRLKGTAKYASTPDMKVVVSITMQGKSAEQARFTPIAATEDAHAGKKH